MTWLISLLSNPLVRKIALYAAVGLAILFAVRWYSNRAYYQGVQEGRDKATTEIQKAKEAEWKAESDNLAEQAKAIAASKLTVESERAELARARVTMQDTLSRSLNEILLTQGTNDAKVDAVPADALDDALRAQSAKLAAAVGK